jgi:hypothetical protein
MSKYYAAAGSSKTPQAVLKLMENVAAFMYEKGFTLRVSESGPADQTFIRSCKGRFFSFIPHGMIDEGLDNPDAPEYSSSVWGITSDIMPGSGDATFARSLNPAFLMLSTAEKQWEVVANSLIYGLERVHTARMLICWSDGTDHVQRYIKVAEGAGVKVYNLKNPTSRALIEKMLSN